MIKQKGPEAFKSPVSSHTQAKSVQCDSEIQATRIREPVNGANYDLTGSYIQADQGMNTRTPYHQQVNQPTSAMGGAPHGQEDFVPLRAAVRVRRQDPVDDEPSSRAKMWDPVKDCSDPNNIEANLPSFLPTRHNSIEHFMESPISGFSSSRQQFTNAGTRGAASMSLPSYLQRHAMASGYQGSASMGSQQFQVGPLYDQIQRSRQHKSGYQNISILPPHLRESCGQNEEQSLDSITRGAASMGIQSRQTGHSHCQSQEIGYQFMGMEPRMPASTASHLPAHHRENFNNSGSYSSPSMSLDLPSRRRPDSHQASSLQGQTPSQTANISKALSMARYAETMEQQSNITEAVRAYKQVRALFQEVIIRGCSVQERTECNNAWNTYEARLDVLLRDSVVSTSNPPPDQDDQLEDDGPGRGKPQYSLSEDWALCHKDEEELSWQEVAETPIFKGKRKHRSLSQRKHTIGKMGPKYHEAENPWTEEEKRKLCTLGDAGKTLGEIHRKFRSRNAERCLNQYFRLKGYHTTSTSRTRTSH